MSYYKSASNHLIDVNQNNGLLTSSYRPSAGDQHALEVSLVFMPKLVWTLFYIVVMTQTFIQEKIFKFIDQC